VADPGLTLIGRPGVSTHVLAANVDRRWVLYRQAREDTDGDGDLAVGGHGRRGSDRVDTWLDMSGREQRLDGVVGVTGDEVVAVLAGRIVAINAITAETTDLAPLGVASGPGLSEIDWPEIGTREYPEAAVFDRHLVHLITRFEAELIDRTSARRTALSSAEWIHAVWIDRSGWVVLEVLDRAPAGESVLERPHAGPPPEVMGVTYVCFGPRVCDGPERTWIIRRLVDPLQVERVRGRALHLRRWGYVVENSDGTVNVVTPTGSNALGPQCPVRFIGFASPLVMAACPDRTWDIAHRAVELDEIDLGAAALLRATQERHVRVDRAREELVAGDHTFRWDEHEGRWRETRHRPCGVLALGADRSALVSVDGCPRCPAVEMTQLAWTQPIAPDIAAACEEHGLGSQL